jgi:hypothetical protein
VQRHMHAPYTHMHTPFSCSIALCGVHVESDTWRQDCGWARVECVESVACDGHGMTVQHTRTVCVPMPR